MSVVKSKKMGNALRTPASSNVDLEVFDAITNDKPLELKALLQEDDFKKSYKTTDPREVPHGFYYLHLAAFYGALECIKYMKEIGVDLNVGCNMGYTALVWAMYGDSERFKTFDSFMYLLNNGADHSILTNGGSSIAMKATELNKLEFLEKLIERGANLTVKNRIEESAVLLASKHTNCECLQLLIDNGATIIVTDNEGNTPAHNAARKGSVHCLQLLIDNGADLSQANNERMTPAQVVVGGCDK